MLLLYLRLLDFPLLDSPLPDSRLLPSPVLDGEWKRIGRRAQVGDDAWQGVRTDLAAFSRTRECGSGFERLDRHPDGCARPALRPRPTQDLSHPRQRLHGVELLERLRRVHPGGSLEPNDEGVDGLHAKHVVFAPERGHQQSDRLRVLQSSERDHRVTAGRVALPKAILALDPVPGPAQPPEVDVDVVLVRLSVVTQLVEGLGEQLEEVLELVEVLDDPYVPEVQLVDTPREPGLEPPLVVADLQVDPRPRVDQLPDPAVLAELPHAVLGVAPDDVGVVEAGVADLDVRRPRHLGELREEPAAVDREEEPFGVHIRCAKARVRCRAIPVAHIVRVEGDDPVARRDLDDVAAEEPPFAEPTLDLLRELPPDLLLAGAAQRLQQAHVSSSTGRGSVSVAGPGSSATRGRVSAPTSRACAGRGSAARASSS